MSIFILQRGLYDEDVDGCHVMMCFGNFTFEVYRAQHLFRPLNIKIQRMFCLAFQFDPSTLPYRSAVKAHAGFSLPGRHV